MPLPGLIYPSRIFARGCDPLKFGGGIEEQAELSTSQEMLNRIQQRIEELIQ